jgi:Protein of unknown function (DUF1488)
MPLAATHMPVVLDDRRNAIGVWMTVKGARPVQPIRVFVTYGALAQIEPSQPWSRRSATAIFDRNRARIEATASVKFDAIGVDAAKCNGLRMVMVRPDDL